MPKNLSEHVAIKPDSVLEQPELAAHIVVISNYWTEIEEELARIYAAGMGSDLALATVTLGRVNSFPAKLDMIKTVLAHAISIEAADRFEAMRREIRACSGKRSEIVHCHWTTHERHPDCLIRVIGLSDPHLKQWAYSQLDFAKIVLRLLKLQIVLREFLHSLPDDLRNNKPRRSAWQVASQDQDQEPT